MITCTLKDKKYAVDFISGRALREMEPAAKMYAQIVALSNAAVKGEEIPQEQQISVTDAMDVMIRWFCLLFGNQFSPDDVLDGYPVDRLMHDIALALMAVQTQTTEILSEFPTKAAKEPASPPKTAEEIPTVLTLPEFIYSTYNSLLESGWRMDEIDRMDMLGFLKIRAWNAKQEQKKKEPRQRYIDEVWSSLSPSAM